MWWCCGKGEWISLHRSLFTVLRLLTATTTVASPAIPDKQVQQTPPPNFEEEGDITVHCMVVEMDTYDRGDGDQGDGGTYVVMVMVMVVLPLVVLLMVVVMAV